MLLAQVLVSEWLTRTLMILGVNVSMVKLVPDIIEAHRGILDEMVIESIY